MKFKMKKKKFSVRCLYPTQAQKENGIHVGLYYSEISLNMMYIYERAKQWFMDCNCKKEATERSKMKVFSTVY